MLGSRLVTTERVICIAAPGTSPVVETVTSVAHEHGLSVTSYEVGEEIEEERLKDDDVLAVVIGGDGTFLSAVNTLGPHEIPILSVDVGTLGFLMTTPPDAIETTVAEILSGDAVVSERLQVQVSGPDIEETGINEVQFDSPYTLGDIRASLFAEEAESAPRTCELDVFVDSEYVGQYSGGGLLVNTPTGSTAMALSAGGPVHVPAENQTLQITPLQTENTGVRPIVVGTESTITVIPSTPTRVSVDGVRPELIAEAGTEFAITGSDTPLYLVHGSQSESLMNSLRDKLGWNARLDATTRQSSPEGPSDLYTTASSIAHDAVYSAGRPIRRLYERIERSESGFINEDVVGAALARSERILTAILGTGFPEHTIVSEGWTVQKSEGEYTWVVDPLDGTGNFAHGNPSFTVSVALLEDGDPVIGVVYSPITDDLFHAITGRGAYRNDTRIEPTARTRLDESMLLSGYDPTGAFLKQFYREARGVRRLGSASLHLCYVAAGSADAHWEYDTYPWDVAAGLCILREAGGTATHVDGRSYELNLEETEQRSTLLSSNGSLHGTLLESIPEDGFEVE